MCSQNEGYGGLQQYLNPIPILMQLMKLILIMICVALVANFIPIAYTDSTAYVYPYIDAYELLENVPIVSRDTAYYHPKGNKYISIFHEYFYYGKHMKHSFINTNHIKFNVLELFDNMIRENDLYIEMDDELNVPVKCKGLSVCSLHMCQHMLKLTRADTLT